MRDRTLRIIYQLLNTDKISIRALSEVHGVSNRTIRNEINDVSQLLQSLSLPEVQLSRGSLSLDLNQSERKKLYQSLKEKGGKDYLYPDERFVTLLFDFLNNNGKVFIVNEQEKLRISKSTMDDDMRRLRRFLHKYGLKISTNPKKGVRIIGNERFIRTMIHDVINQYVDIGRLIYDYDNYMGPIPNKIKDYFPKQTLLCVKQIYYEKLVPKSLKINDLFIQQIILLTAIWIIRVKQKNFLDSEISNHDLNRTPAINSFVNQLIKCFNLQISQGSERKYIAFIIESFDADKKPDITNWVNAQIITVSLIEYMESALAFPFSKSEELFEGVYNHVTGLLNRLNWNINICNPLKQTIKHNYAEIFKNVANFMKQLGQSRHLKISEDEIGYLSIYFSTAEVKIEKKEYFRYRIAIVCNYGVATGKLLGARLEDEFNIDVIAVLGTTEVKILPKLSVDLVVKTVAVDTNSIPSIKLNPIPLEADMQRMQAFLDENQNLLKFDDSFMKPTLFFKQILDLVKKSQVQIDKSFVFNLKKIFRHNHLEINEREVQPMLRDLLKDNQIMLGKEAKDWRDAIAKTAEPLLRDSYIVAKYITAMIKSVEEFGPYIVIGPGIALAHARPEDGAKKLGVSIMTLKNPVYFGNPENDPVFIVFCLSAVDNYSHLNVMKTIVQLINDTEKIRNLASESDIQRFKRILFDEVIQK